MHDDEVDTNVESVRRLLTSQHPQWAELPIERVSSAGTDNAMYRLGEELAVQLAGVIDWGTCGVGDPAIETTVAWSLFSPDARNAYRDAVGFDDDTWERGKGWVVSGVYGIPYYRDTNPVLVADKIKGIEAVLADST